METSELKSAEASHLHAMDRVDPHIPPSRGLGSWLRWSGSYRQECCQSTVHQRHSNALLFFSLRIQSYWLERSPRLANGTGYTDAKFGKQQGFPLEWNEHVGGVSLGQRCMKYSRNTRFQRIMVARKNHRWGLAGGEHLRPLQ